MKTLNVLLALLVLVSCQTNKKQQPNSEIALLVGTYTGESKGIYTYYFNQENGDSRFCSLAEIENPSYLTFSENKKFVYAVSEGDSEENSKINAFSYDSAKNALTFINSQPSAGTSPCYVAADQNFVYVANYGSGSVSAFPIQQNGSINEISDKFDMNACHAQNIESHAHCVCLAPHNSDIFVSDLGYNRIYKMQNQSGKLAVKNYFTLPEGSGPRHLTFDQAGKYLYLIDEKSGNVHAFEYGDTLKEIQSIAADTVGAQGSADIHISPDGKFLYASNRLQADGIAIFKIDINNGMLTKVGYQLTGIHPRNFVITPNGKYLLCANRGSNQIQIFSRNADSGLLSDIHKDIKLSKPVCLKFY